VDLELTDELDLNNLFIFGSLGLLDSDFYCFDPSTVEISLSHFISVFQLGVLGHTSVSYPCILPTYLALSSALDCANGMLTLVSFSY
jgi:hypothetical protein